jgi:adenylate cyclase class IV
MQNVEFKAELRHAAAARRQCEQLGAKEIGTLRQTDTYYRLTDGRLKRREAPGEPVEWIFYHRPDAIDPALCRYTILSEEQASRRWGTHALKPWLTVVKTRELWLLDNVRIHLDEVDELGTFIEFEAMVSPKNDAVACERQVMKLREIFAPVLGEPISVGYCDLAEQLDPGA